MSVQSSEQKKNPSKTKWAKNRTLILWPIESEEVNAHAPTSTRQREGVQAAMSIKGQQTIYLFIFTPTKAVDPGQ
jgi:hypothetical protein